MCTYRVDIGAKATQCKLCELLIFLLWLASNLEGRQIESTTLALPLLDQILNFLSETSLIVHSASYYSRDGDSFPRRRGSADENGVSNKVVFTHHGS